MYPFTYWSEFIESWSQRFVVEPLQNLRAFMAADQLGARLVAITIFFKKSFGKMEGCLFYVNYRLFPFAFHQDKFVHLKGLSFH